MSSQDFFYAQTRVFCLTTKYVLYMLGRDCYLFSFLILLLQVIHDNHNLLQDRSVTISLQLGGIMLICHNL